MPLWLAARPLVLASKSAIRRTMLAEAGIPVEVVPGITSAQAAASRLGVSLTQRELARRVQYITAHGASGRLPADIDWRSVADPSTTTVVYMPQHTLPELAATALAHGIAPDTPAIAVASATRPDEQVISATIATIAAQLAHAAPAGPVLVMIGQALGVALVQQVSERATVERNLAS